MSGAQLPAQATGQTLPGQAADAADIAPATDATSALLAANFGDKGAAQYKALLKAGQQSATPAAPAAPTAPPASTPAPGTAPGVPSGGSGASWLLGGGGNDVSPIYQLLAGATGTAGVDKSMAMQAKAARDQQAAMQQAAEKGAEFLEKLRTGNVPPDVRVALIQQTAAQQGRQLSPAEATYIAHFTADPELIQHLSERIKAGDVAAVADFNSLFSGDPTKMISAADSIRKSHADADKAVSDAEKATTLNSPTHLAAEAESKALDVANKMKNLQRPPTAAELQVLDAAGLEAYQAPVPGVAGSTMWSTRPKGGGTPGVVDVTGMNNKATERSAAAAQAKEDATTTASTRTMQETVPKVLGFISRIYKDLDKVSTGPAASRYQEFMTGKVGAPNPDFATYRTNVALLTTLLMRMHTGSRTSSDMLAHFKGLLDSGRQSPENMRAALDTVKAYAEDIAAEKKPRPGAPAAAAPTGEISAADFLNQ